MFDKLDLLLERVLEWEGDSPSRQVFVYAVFILGLPGTIVCIAITLFAIALTLLLGI